MESFNTKQMTMTFPFNVIDLTHALNEDIPTWSGHCGYEAHLKHDYQDSQEPTSFRVQHLSISAGIGTHMDAPAHCIPGGITIGELELNDLIRPAHCIDISGRANAENQLTSQDILIHEKKHGDIAPDDFCLIYTGWDRYWKNPKQYHNQYRFPTITEEAALLLIERDISGLGIDTLSPDGPSSGFPVHRLMLGTNRYIVENVANGQSLPATGAYVMALPIKGEALTEAPIRMIGLVPTTSQS